MSKLEKLKERARSLEAKDPKGALDAWREALKGQQEEGEANPDLSIYNRIGDLYTKLRDPAQAADFYDQAVDKYAELGFHNNAIAMCNKVLRNAPGRQTTYLKLAKLYASKGFMAEAKQNFVAYAERMHKMGRIQHAFAALKELADISAESAHLRDALAEHLRMYGDPDRRSGAESGGAGADRAEGEGNAPVAGAPPKAKPGADLTKSGRWKSSNLVFLDVDAPPARKGQPGAGGPRVTPPLRSAAPAPPPPATPPPPPPQPEPEPVSESLVEPAVAEPDSSLEIESTSLVEGLDPTGAGGALEGFETTTVEFGDVRLAADEVPPLRDEVSAVEIPPPAEFEPTVVEEGAGDAADELASLPETDLERQPPTAGSSKASELPKVKPFVPKRPAASPPSKPAVEVPPLELEPDFESGAVGEADEGDEQPVVIEQGHTTEGKFPSAPGRRSVAIDLNLDGVVIASDDAGSLAYGDVGSTSAKPTIEELEVRVADDPDDPERHRVLGEALVEAGERERGIQELDLATTGFEGRGNLSEAQTLVAEILRLDPNSVRHRQKQVEFAFKSGDKAKLIDAYLGLADTLLRGDLPDKARAVYKRVGEHDPSNERAQAALAMLAPAATPAPVPHAAPKKKARADEERTAPRDAKLKVRDEAVDGGDFVDLGAMILDDARPERDTRMKIADEEPTGDEERDFQEMLARFKQGIDENIDEGDFQSHYDLGVAFKEMGLLDEAIAELQKALQAPEGKLRSSEALGVCFIEKGAYTVAESILRRALELPASSDQDRLGVLYWLARALEELGKRAEARELYGRVFAVDIRFRDVGERSKALAKAK